jgi:hypothetical protein
MEAISSTRALVSRGVVFCERSWESLAWRQGWVEMWTLGGRDIVEDRMGGLWNEERKRSESRKK